MGAMLKDDLCDVLLSLCDVWKGACNVAVGKP